MPRKDPVMVRDSFSKAPLFLLLGRPNVGKSTLFNRLTHQGRAVISAHAGTTQDILEAPLKEGCGVLADAPGLQFLPFDLPYAQQCFQRASVHVWVVDGQVGLTDEDAAFAKFLRKSGHETVVVVNKCDGSHTDKDLPSGYWDFTKLGFSTILPISAREGQGLAALTDLFSARVHSFLGRQNLVQEEQDQLDGAGGVISEENRVSHKAHASAQEKVKNDLQFQCSEQFLDDQNANQGLLENTESWLPEDKPFQIALLGKPNVGKSTLTNALLCQERMAVSDRPGLTRDAIGVSLTIQGKNCLLWDTAGLRRKDKRSHLVQRGIVPKGQDSGLSKGHTLSSGGKDYVLTRRQEQAGEALCHMLSQEKTLRALRFSHVVLIMMDATQAFQHYDLALVQKVLEEGRAPILVLNKWDKVQDPQAFRRALDTHLDALVSLGRGMLWVTVSAEKKQGLGRLKAMIALAAQRWSRRVSTGALNSFWKKMCAENPPPFYQKGRAKIRYVTQAKTRPPTFVVAGSSLQVLPMSYKRYVANQMRTAFDWHGIPLRFIWKNSDNPYGQSLVRGHKKPEKPPKRKEKKA